jgi:hypothetical protein
MKTSRDDKKFLTESDNYRGNGKFQSFPIQRIVSIIEENQKNGMKVAEIGTCDGSTVKGYIDIIEKNNGHHYSIDTFVGTIITEENFEAFPHYKNAVYGSYGPWNDNLYETFQDNFIEYKNCMTILKGKSADIIPLLPDDMDIIIIDASHYYKDVVSDIKLCLTKIKDGGIICGDDCEDMSKANTFTEWELKMDAVNEIHCGVVQAVYDIFGNDVNINRPVWSKIIVRN